ncbi:MAG TPA: hypothetical protein VKE51_14090 [Vicinamibacterales bacterium]|nr:hypothetical protein [Vicinamibacterales bacterium]
MVTSLSTNQMQALARAGARVRLEELRAEIAMLERLLRDSGAATRGRRTAASARPRRRGQLSPAGRAAIAAAQKARWAKVKAAKTAAASGEAPTSPGKPARPRRRRSMSAAARKAVSSRMRKYWAARRKARGQKRKTGARKASATPKG